jgi:tRNA U38,U39,U40 pseudouridine synthase TruA
MFRLKKIMQRLQTLIVPLSVPDKSSSLKDEGNQQQQSLTKDNHNTDATSPHTEPKEGHSSGGRSRRRIRRKKTPTKKEETTTAITNNNNHNNHHTKSEGAAASASSSKKFMMKRRRFHNFTPKAMAHDSLVYRRLDKCFHRATIRSTTNPNTNRPFLVLSMTGDMFLQGQVTRMVGLIIALMRGLIDVDFIECVLDENYPHLIPTPPAPTFAMYMTEAGYDLWEGKAQAVLTARNTQAFPKGWNDPALVQRVFEWKTAIRQNICTQWEHGGQNQDDGGLVLVQDWITSVLHPWAKKAQHQLMEYRQWKQQQMQQQSIDQHSVWATGGTVPRTMGPASSGTDTDDVDKSVPPVYQRVLNILRDIDQSGRWPSTSTKRQLVMVSTTTTLDEGTTTTAHSGTTTTTTSDLAWNLASLGTAQRSSSAYIFQEGQGGASGSFTVGAFPGSGQQPKSNQEFQDLMIAAFELEVALRPDRPSSSTIAINRNAQFRPHTDSGAGAGQSTSLIVGMGDYVGGELVVEGETKDIRYNPVEFNGWKERHW